MFATKLLHLGHSNSTLALLWRFLLKLLMQLEEHIELLRYMNIDTWLEKLLFIFGIEQIFDLTVTYLAFPESERNPIWVWLIHVAPEWAFLIFAATKILMIIVLYKIGQYAKNLNQEVRRKFSFFLLIFVIASPILIFSPTFLSLIF